MSIIGQNTLLNQFVPSITLTNLQNNQALVYNSTTRTFVNKTIEGTGGTVTDISVDSNNGIVGIVSNPTTTPLITLTLNNITPTSVAATGTVTGSNLSGTNTGDQTITLTGDVTGTGTGSFAATLTNTTVTPGSYTAANITVDAKGRITSASNGSAGGGTVTSVEAVGDQGVSVSGAPITSSGTISIGLGAITPTSVAATGTVTGSNLSGTNTGDQTITLTGDVTGTGTGTFAATLANTAVTPGSYGTTLTVPRVAINSKGLINTAVDEKIESTTADMIPQDEIIFISPRRQYIITGRLEIIGHIINNGRIAIL